MPRPDRRGGLASLRIWYATSAADVLPGDRVVVVVELRSETLREATLTHTPPPGLTLESAEADAGAMQPGLTWSGVVSATQPINLRLTYRVSGPPRDVTLRVDGAGQTAETTLRICCVEAQPPPRRHIYLPIFWR